MGDAYLITGVPGFIGNRLVRELLPEGRRIYLLCQERFEADARRFVESLANTPGVGRDAPSLCRVVTGDITLADAGLEGGTLEEVRAEVGEVYHLAAIYDLAVEKELARRCNIEGTRNVCRLIESIPGCRHSYVSTCYVCGDREGMVFEDELEKGQGFKNHYESTKYEAERIVRAAQGRVETRIFRPSVVIGDSRTGETSKFDGPYFAFRAMLMGLLTVLPGQARAPINLVPVDFIVRALAKIPKQPGTAGKTFALADPDPPAANEVVRHVADRLQLPRPKGRVPAWVFRAALTPKTTSGFFGIPKETVDYFNKVVYFDTTNTRAALEGTGIACPPLPHYLNVILRYFLERVELPWSLARA